MFDFTSVLVNLVAIGIQKVIEVHIEIIGNKMRIQASPGNPYFLTASTTSLAVEVHDRPDLFRQQKMDYQGYKKSHPQSLADGFWLLLSSEGE